MGTTATSARPHSQTGGITQHQCEDGHHHPRCRRDGTVEWASQPVSIRYMLVQHRQHNTRSLIVRYNSRLSSSAASRGRLG